MVTAEQVGISSWNYKVGKWNYIIMPEAPTCLTLVNIWHHNKVGVKKLHCPKKWTDFYGNRHLLDRDTGRYKNHMETLSPLAFKTHFYCDGHVRHLKSSNVFKPSSGSQTDLTVFTVLITNQNLPPVHRGVACEEWCL